MTIHSPTRSRRAGPRTLLATLCAATACTLVPAGPARAQEAAPRDGLHDFDFVIGRWKVHLRKLMHPLTGSTEWVDYEGTSVMTKIWGDRANMEEFDVTSLDGRLRIEAQTLRLYNPRTHEWNIWLAKAAEGQLLGPPTIGSFHDGRGEFFDWEAFGARSILVRYVWTRPTATTAHMEQSFSPDWGRTWEVNWICDLAPQS